LMPIPHRSRCAPRSRTTGTLPDDEPLPASRAFESPRGTTHITTATARPRC
jgi:hypothetical protein